MLDQPTSSSATEEARLELAVAAAATERANKPRWIIVLGAVLLAVTTVFTLVQASARGAQLSKVKLERSATQKVEDLKAEIDAEAAKLASRGTAANPRMGQEIEAYAVGAGVLLAGPVVDSTLAAQNSIGMQQHKYTARAMNQDPLSILNWLNNTQTSAERTGLEIIRLRLTPGAGTSSNTPGWNVDVEFSRWERLNK
jgi:uncharacterized protein YlxW (UPF0749 family)